MNRFVGLALIIGGVGVVFVGLLLYSGWLFVARGACLETFATKAINVQVLRADCFDADRLGCAKRALLFAASLFSESPSIDKLHRVFKTEFRAPLALRQSLSQFPRALTHQFERPAFCDDEVADLVVDFPIG